MVGIYAFFVFTVLDYIVKILSKSDIDDSPTMRVISIILLFFFFFFFFFKYQIIFRIINFSFIIY